MGLTSSRTPLRPVSHSPGRALRRPRAPTPGRHDRARSTVMRVSAVLVAGLLAVTAGCRASAPSPESHVPSPPPPPPSTTTTNAAAPVPPDPRIGALFL